MRRVWLELRVPRAGAYREGDVIEVRDERFFRKFHPEAVWEVDIHGNKKEVPTCRHCG